MEKLSSLDCKQVWYSFEGDKQKLSASVNSKDGWTFSPSSEWNDHVGSSIKSKLAEIISSAQTQAANLISQAEKNIPAPYSGEPLDKICKEYRDKNWDPEISHIDYL